MSRIVIYQFIVPEMIAQTTHDPPILTGRHLAVPVVTCPQLDKGDRTPLETCETCEFKKLISYHFLECDYVQTQEEKDETERRKKGATVVKPIQPPMTKDPGQPKNVFTMKK